MKQNKTKISIIIPTYNRSNMLNITLDSFINQKYPQDQYEIIISNNNSTDNTQEVIDKYCSKYNFIKTIFVKQQGVHYARNKAAKMSQGEILYFTDDDMIADENLLLELIKVFELDSMVASATGLILPKFEVEPPKWVENNLINGWLSLTPKNKKESLIISEDNCGVWSCHQAIKREVFFSSGGFNPENTKGVWIGDGETGLNIKVKELGYKFAYIKKSIIYHMIPPERMTKEYIIKRIGNQAYCDSYTAYRKHRDIDYLKSIVNDRLPKDMPNKLKHLAKLVDENTISEYFLPAFTQYYLNMYNYENELITNDKFREVVEVDNWLECDMEISTKLLK